MQEAAQAGYEAHELMKLNELPGNTGEIKCSFAVQS